MGYFPNWTEAIERVDRATMVKRYRQRRILSCRLCHQEHPNFYDAWEPTAAEDAAWLSEQGGAGFVVYALCMSCKEQPDSAARVDEHFVREIERLRGRIAARQAELAEQVKPEVEQ